MLARLFALWFLAATAAAAEETVCSLLKNARTFDGKPVTVQDELILSADVTVLGSKYCDFRLVEEHSERPIAIELQLPPGDLQQWNEARAKVSKLRKEGRWFSASASLQGRLELSRDTEFPAALQVSRVDAISIQELPDPDQLPVIPICDLFQNLTAWQGKRIAVRGYQSAGHEGSWLYGTCRGEFVTDGYRWPVLLHLGSADYTSDSTWPLTGRRTKAEPIRHPDLGRDSQSPGLQVTYSGELRLRTGLKAICRPGGDWLTTGFGHLGSAAAELILEAEFDREFVKLEGSGSAPQAEPCTPSRPPAAKIERRP